MCVTKYEREILERERIRALATGDALGEPDAMRAEQIANTCALPLRYRDDLDASIAREIRTRIAQLLRTYGDERVGAERDACDLAVLEQRCERGTTWDAAIMACSAAIKRRARSEGSAMTSKT